MLEKFNSCGDDFITSYLHPLFGANNDSEMFSLANIVAKK
jgi:hypothetical protein